MAPTWDSFMNFHNILESDHQDTYSEGWKMEVNWYKVRAVWWLFWDIPNQIPARKLPFVGLCGVLAPRRAFCNNSWQMHEPPRWLWIRRSLFSYPIMSFMLNKTLLNKQILTMYSCFLIAPYYLSAVIQVWRYAWWRLSGHKHKLFRQPVDVKTDVCRFA
jgi:hypothetical protein